MSHQPQENKMKVCECGHSDSIHGKSSDGDELCMGGYDCPCKKFKERKMSGNIWCEHISWDDQRSCWVHVSDHHFANNTPVYAKIISCPRCKTPRPTNTKKDEI